MVEGTLDVTIDGAVENLKVFVPSDSDPLSQDLYFFRPLRTPVLATPLQFKLAEQVDGFTISAINFVVGGVSYPLHPSESLFVSELIPADLAGVL